MVLNALEKQVRCIDNACTLDKGDVGMVSNECVQEMIYAVMEKLFVSTFTSISRTAHLAAWTKAIISAPRVFPLSTVLHEW